VTSSPPLVLSLRGITRRFGSLVANDAIDLDLARGEILALLGENGAGKTTLMNILFGHYVADAGEVLAADASGNLAPLPPGSPHAALAAGIGMVHQHFTLAENLTGFDNIVLGTEPLWRPTMRRGAALAKLDALMARSGLTVDLDVPVTRLSVGERQRVEILKALYRDVRILVLDEPTAVLTPQEAETLFVTLRALARDGLSIIFISHKLNEVLALADRVGVLRGGRKVADVPAAGQDRTTLANLMVGEPVAPTTHVPRAAGDVLLELVDVTIAGGDARSTLRGVNLRVRAGEIVGIAGVSGNGQSALAALIGGLTAPTSGNMLLFGNEPDRFDPAAFVRAGVGRIPEDRHRDGIVGAMSISENVSIEDIRLYQRLGLLRAGAMRARAETAIADYAVKCPGPDAPIRVLSGGNIQKLILARVLERGPQLILANQPTRGLDVGAISEVHRRLLKARDAGAAVVLISEDLDEIFALADRIAVMFRGTLTTPRPTGTFDLKSLGALMGGHSADALAEAPT
jgi:simple sugar transport system ATP-binding protein